MFISFENINPNFMNFNVANNNASFIVSLSKQNVEIIHGITITLSWYVGVKILAQS